MLVERVRGPLTDALVRRERRGRDLRALADRRGDKAGLDQRDVNAERPQLVPQRLGVALERELAGGIERAKGNRGDPGERADRDDLARARCAHPWQHGLYHPYDAEEIRLELRFRFSEAGFLGRSHQGVAGIVDEHVDLSDTLHAGAYGVVGAHIERDEIAGRLPRRAEDGEA